MTSKTPLDMLEHTRPLFPRRRVIYLAIAVAVASACEGNRPEIVAPGLAPPSGILTERKVKELKRSVVIVTAPSGGYAGEPLVVQPQVAIEDSKGRQLVGPAVITASVVETSGTLTGTTAVNSVNGIATFTDLSIDEPGTYTIQFSAKDANPVTATVTLTAREIEVSLTPIADTDVQSAYPTTSFGTLQDASVRSEQYSPNPSYVYLRFDLSSIPAGAEILESSLTMTAYDGFARGGDGTVYLYFVSNDTWGETSATWNTRPTPDLQYFGSWWIWYTGGSPSIQIGLVNTEALRAQVATEQSGDGLLSIMLRSPGYDTFYYTREAATPNQRPNLKVRYTPGP